jgi:hypothetical protein
MTRLSVTYFLIFIAIAGAGLGWQQPPKTVFIVRNDSTGAVDIEYRSNDQCQKLRLEPGTDSSATGDRVRVATRREDKAIITVDLPVEGGKKYRLFWNTQSSIWDFSPAL